MGLTVNDANRFMIGGSCGVGLEILYQIIFFLLAVIFFAVNMLTANLVPHLEEYLLQGIHLATINAAVHVMPFAYYFCTIDIIVGNVHTSCIGNLSINDHDFTVITVEDGMYPWKLNRLVFIYFNAIGTYFLEMPFAQRLVIG